MYTISHTDNAEVRIKKLNANLQALGSVVVLSESITAKRLANALNAEFYGIDGAQTLSMDDNAQTFASKVNANFALGIVGGTVKEQYHAEVADTISKASALLDGDNTLSFLLVTDIHYHPLEAVTIPELDTHFDDTVENMKAVNAGSPMDALLCLGDIIEGNPTLEDSIDDAEHMMTAMSAMSLPPVLVALGNHDNNRDGFGSDNATLSREQMKAMYMDYIDLPDANFSDAENKADFYVDYPAKQIRVIQIYGNGGQYSDGRTGNYLYDDVSRRWLNDRLDDMPSGYKAIVVTHVPPISKANYNNTVRNGGEEFLAPASSNYNYTPTYNKTVKQIITEHGSDVIALFYGHCHNDNVWAEPFVCIGTCCNKGSDFNGSCDNWGEDAYMPLRDAEDETADLFDAVVVNTDTETIDMVRFGAGADRTIHYEAIECAAGSSVTLTSKISGGTWGLRTSDQSKASVANGVVTVGSGIASGTLLSVWCKSSDWQTEIVNGTTTDGAAVKSRKLMAGEAIEYWTIKVS